MWRVGGVGAAEFPFSSPLSSFPLRLYHRIHVVSLCAFEIDCTAALTERNKTKLLHNAYSDDKEGSKVELAATFAISGISRQRPRGASANLARTSARLNLFEFGG